MRTIAVKANRITRSLGRSSVLVSLWGFVASDTAAAQKAGFERVRVRRSFSGRAASQEIRSHGRAARFEPDGRPEATGPSLLPKAHRTARRRTFLLPLLLALSMLTDGHAWAFGLGSTWQEVPIEGFGPFPRADLAATRGVDPAVPSGYIFGGGSFAQSTSGTTFFNTLFEWKATGPVGKPTITFTEIGGSSTAHPSPRGFPTMATVRKGSDTHVYVFGGGTYDSSMALTSAPDKFWDYDVGTGQWHDLSYLGGPSPRTGALMIAWQDDLFLFGGIAESPESGYITHNDLWKFDTEEMVWSLLSNNTGPKQKQIAMGGTIGPEADKKLLVYGGERFVSSSWEFPIDRETWTWNIAKGAWTRNVDGPGHNFAVLSTHTGGALMFGGEEEGGVVGCGAPFYENPTNDLFYYDAQQGIWTKIVDATNTPEPIKRAASVWAAGYLYVFGGFNFVCESEDDPGEIWNETVYRLKAGE